MILDKLAKHNELWLKMLINLGTELSEALLIKSRKIEQFTDFELLEMIEIYTNKVNNLLSK